MPTRAFTYDAAGNVISEDRDGDIYSYTYNAANRLSSVSLNGALQAEYVYNALGQQVRRHLVPSGQIIHSIFDLDGNRIAEYDYDDVAGASSLLREYIWMNGLPVAVIEGGVTYYVRTDHIGRPVFATDSTGAKVWEAIYLPFGEVLTSTGTPITLRFPGQWFQSESGLFQNWMRDYDPTTGRYMQADPLGLVDGASIYGYARQNPGRYTDPRGEYCIPCAIAVIGAIIPEGFFGAGAVVIGGAAVMSIPGDTPTTGEDAQSEALSETGVYCGDPCGDAREDLARAKERVKSLGRCSGNMGRDQLTDRANAFRRLMFTRANRDNICHGGSDTGHGMAITQTRAALGRCQRLLNAL